MSVDVASRLLPSGRPNVTATTSVARPTHERNTRYTPSAYSLSLSCHRRWQHVFSLVDNAVENGTRVVDPSGRTLNPFSRNTITYVATLATSDASSKPRCVQYFRDGIVLLRSGPGVHQYLSRDIILQPSQGAAEWRTPLVLWMSDETAGGLDLAVQLPHSNWQRDEIGILR